MPPKDSKPLISNKLYNEFKKLLKKEDPFPYDFVQKFLKSKEKSKKLNITDARVSEIDLAIAKRNQEPTERNQEAHLQKQTSSNEKVQQSSLKRKAIEADASEETPGEVVGEVVAPEKTGKNKAASASTTSKIFLDKYPPNSIWEAISSQIETLLDHRISILQQQNLQMQKSIIAEIAALRKELSLSQNDPRKSDWWLVCYFKLFAYSLSPV